MATRAQLRFAVRRKLAETGQFADPLTGTVTVAAGAELVTGTDTFFTSAVMVGAEIQIGGEIRQVDRIDSDTVLHVNRAFTAAQTNAAVSQLSLRGWSDDLINDELNAACGSLHTSLLEGAAELLRTRVAATLPATRTATVPATLANIEGVEVLADAALTDYRPLRCLTDAQWSGGLSGWGAGMGLSMGGAGTPTSYRWVDIQTIEFDCIPSTALANGLRWRGFLASMYLDTDAATIALPEAAKIEEILVNSVVAECLLTDATQTSRATAFRARANNGTAELVRRWNRGRQAGPLSVNLVR
jgi:hypothetical protein